MTELDFSPRPDDGLLRFLPGPEPHPLFAYSELLQRARAEHADCPLCKRGLQATLRHVVPVNVSGKSMQISATCRACGPSGWVRRCWICRAVQGGVLRSFRTRTALHLLPGAASASYTP